MRQLINKQDKPSIKMAEFLRLWRFTVYFPHALDYRIIKLFLSFYRPEEVHVHKTSMRQLYGGVLV